MTTATALLLGAGVGLGVCFVWIGSTRSIAGVLPADGESRSILTSVRMPSIRKVAAVVIPGVVVGVVTGWPVAAVLGASAGYFVPRIFSAVSVTRATAKSEAIASWAEMLRDSLAGASGLEQAIVVTAPLAPLPIRSHTSILASRVESGMPLGRALRHFAADLDEAGADLVVSALVLATEQRAQRVGDLLGALAGAAREEVAMRMRIEASRSSVRTGIRVVSAFSVGFSLLLMVLARSYMAPFGTAAGELALGAIGALYATGLTLMIAMARPREFPRLLGDVDGRSGTLRPGLEGAT